MANLLSWISLKKYLVFLVSLSAFTFVLFGLFIISSTIQDNEERKSNLIQRDMIDLPTAESKLRQIMKENSEKRKNLSLSTLSPSNLVSIDAKSGIASDNKFNGISKILNMTKLIPPNYNIHIFYYPWYKSEAFDGKYTHWNHEQLPDWRAKDQVRRRQYIPPGEIGANFYPQLGPYSSADPSVVDTHMRQIRAMGVGVLSVSWYPPHYEKTNETPVDDLMMLLFDSAAKYGLKIAFHIEPYDHRNGETLEKVVKFIIDKYGNHSAFYRTDFHGRQLPVYYIYDSYQIDSELWRDVLKDGGKHSIRNTKYDGIFLGLLVESLHFNHLEKSGFDGFYTYFVTNGFSYGSTWRNWIVLERKARKSNLIFVPSIGPGYLDTRVRPWNGRNTRLRLKGQYYRSSFYSAMATKPKFISITSYNEWHEGTQVEPAIPKATKDFVYTNYKPNGPEYYLNMTRQFVEEYTANMTQQLHHHDNAL